MMMMNGDDDLLLWWTDHSKQDRFISAVYHGTVERNECACVYAMQNMAHEVMRCLTQHNTKNAAHPTCHNTLHALGLQVFIVSLFRNKKLAYEVTVLPVCLCQSVPCGHPYVVL